MNIPIYSPTPGIILYIAEPEGAEEKIWVETGSTIISIEVCKVETTVTAPYSGRCLFYVEPGQAIGQGDLLARIFLD